MKSELFKYTREEIIEAVEYVCKEPSRLYIRSMIIRRMNNVRAETQHNKFNELMDQCDTAANEYFEADKKFKSYLMEVAKKYNILKDDNTFKVSDFFDKATEEEVNTALSLESDMRNKYNKYKKLDRAIDINLGIQKGYHEKKS